MSQDWTEKYRPQSLADVVGNPKCLSELKAWADSWNRGKPTKKAAVLYGSPGIGKTTSAVALANDMGWDVIEMNASDQRTGDAIKAVALRGALTNSFSEDGEYGSSKSGKLKLIVLDEADNLFGKADRGAMPAINELIKETKQPVVLIANDFYELSKKSSTVKTDTLQLSFSKPMSSSMVKALKKICASENVEISDESLKQIAENASGDMRAAVRDLESLAMGKKSVAFEDTEKLSSRVARKSMYDLMYNVFRKNDAMEARKISWDIDEEPGYIMLWIDENLPYEYKDKGDLVRGYEKLSRADIYLGRVTKRMHYGFWSYANEMMTSGVSISRLTSQTNRERFRFPAYMSKLSRSKNARTIKSQICQKIADYIHTSTGRVSKDVLPDLKIMLANDKELKFSVAKNLNLEPEELAFLLETKVDSKAVKEVYETETKPEPKETVAKKTPAENKPAEKPKSQKSLFEW